MEQQIKSSDRVIILPTLSVRNGATAIEFYKKAFDAVELMRKQVRTVKLLLSYLLMAHVFWLQMKLRLMKILVLSRSEVEQ